MNYRTFSRCLLAGLVLFALGSPGAQAQNPDLSGLWVLDKVGGQGRWTVTFSAEGNSWRGISGDDERLSLLLHPAGLRNQWAGDLILEEKHGVKADLVSSDVLELRDLSSGQRWRLTR